MLWCKVVKREHSGPKCTLIQSFYWTDTPPPSSLHLQMDVTHQQVGTIVGAPGRKSGALFLFKANNTEITCACRCQRVRRQRRGERLICWFILPTCATSARDVFGGSLLIYRELAQIFKGRLEPSHGGSDLIPFIRRREKETERLHVSWLALNVKIAHAIISDEKVGTEWICFNIADMGYHIRRDGVEGGGRLLCSCSHSGKALTGVPLYA